MIDTKANKFLAKFSGQTNLRIRKTRSGTARIQGTLYINLQYKIYIIKTRLKNINTHATGQLYQ